MGAPDLRVGSTVVASLEVARRAVALGLASGALGSGLTVQLNDAESLVTGRSSRGCPGIPDLVHISVSCDDDRTTRLETRLWCRSIRRRAVVQALLLGGVVATVGSLLFGWLITWSVPAAMGAGVLAERLLWWRDRRCLRSRIHAFVRNLGQFEQSHPEDGLQSDASS